MKKFSLGALVASGLLMGGLTAGSASAADLGGNCCADLEERIAELEATTARKGNRKVVPQGASAARGPGSSPRGLRRKAGVSVQIVPPDFGRVGLGRRVARLVRL